MVWKLLQGVGIDTIVEACSVLGTELVVVNNTPTCKPCDHGHTMRIGDTRCRQCGVFDTSIKWTKIGFVGSCAELGAAEDRQRAIVIAAGEASEDDDPCGTACLIGILLSVFGIVIPVVATCACWRASCCCWEKGESSSNEPTRPVTMWIEGDIPEATVASA
jgi:hypothetical protein